MNMDRTRLSLFTKAIFHESTTSCILEEKKQGGEAQITVNLCNPSLVFSEFDKRKISVFNEDRCADGLIFECKENKWILHIFELKKTLTAQKWTDDVLSQYRGAYVRALMLADFLKITFLEVVVYVGFREERMQARNVDATTLRMGINQRKESALYGYDQNKVKINVFSGIDCRLVKIPLSKDDGKGTISL